jgi:hypothetical protein
MKADTCDNDQSLYVLVVYGKKHLGCHRSLVGENQKADLSKEHTSSERISPLCPCFISSSCLIVLDSKSTVCKLIKNSEVPSYISTAEPSGGIGKGGK